MPSPVAHESAKTAITRSSSTLERGRLREQVDLVQHDDLRALVEPGAVRRELGVDRRATAPRPGFDASITWIEHPRPLEVREELVAEADALARALDQPGHVGDDELPRRRARRPCRAPAASVVNG